MTAHAHQASSPEALQGVSPLGSPATHQTATGAGGSGHATVRDVVRVLALPFGDLGRPLGLGMTPLNYLPFWARLSIDRLNCSSSLRTAEQLDELMQADAHFYRETVDLQTCASAHRICSRRFFDFIAMAGSVDVGSVEVAHA